jgi:predicted regulator of Ras-like GTPase activity (Roadblock/LC7/MglB family)
MVFGDLLRNLVESVPGAIACLIMGADGIPLEEHKKSADLGIDLQTLAVEYSNLLREIRKNAANLGAEGLQEISVRTEAFTILLRLVNDEYFALFLLDSAGYFGKGRYLLRNTCTQVRTQL